MAVSFDGGLHPGVHRRVQIIRGTAALELVRRREPAVVQDLGACRITR
jgi:hypothetical protein